MQAPFPAEWRVIAHRGGSHLRPENTITAFRHAVELGVDALEMDVRATRDGQLVIMHDPLVDRTTNGSGAVSDHTLAELKSLDAGYHWPLHTATTERPFRGSGLTIPTLEEVLATFPDVPMIIDIKQAQPSIFREFGDLLKHHGRDRNTIVGSFHHGVLTAFRRLFPEFMTSASPREVVRFLLAARMGIPRRGPQALQVPVRSGPLRVTTPRFLKVARACGSAVHVWTINDRDLMRGLVIAGVDGIITDRPDLLLDLKHEELGGWI